jgi:phage repressor protein C with HTH and peptisase S24 domain
MSTEEFTSFSDFVKKCRQRNGLTMQEFGKEIGLTKAAIFNWENDRGAAKNQNLLKLAKFTGYSVDFIAALKFKNEETNFHESNARPVETLKARLISSVTAGSGRDFEDLEAQLQEQVATTVKDPNAFALEIDGDSMLPEYRPGDFVIANPNLPPKEGKIVIAKDKAGRIFIKRFHITGREEITLESLNPALDESGAKKFKDLKFRPEEIEWIYPVLNHTRNNLY